MDTITLVGLVASIFTGVSLLPQLVKIIKEKKAESISYGMLGTLFAGLCAWIVYGVLKTDWIIIISNSFSVLVNIIISIFSFKYKKKE
jgi:MtN3 and saliva related transmembrane protein